MGMHSVLKQFAIAILGCAVLGCESQSRPLGQVIDPALPKVLIADLVRDGARYDGKTVQFEGVIGTVSCADCGGALVLDKTWRILVEPSDPTAWRVPATPGARIRAAGEVTWIEAAQRVSLRAHGIELL